MRMKVQNVMDVRASDGSVAAQQVTLVLVRDAKTPPMKQASVSLTFMDPADMNQLLPDQLVDMGLTLVLVDTPAAATIVRVDAPASAPVIAPAPAA